MRKLMIAAMMLAAVSAKAQFEMGTFSLQPKVGGTAAWLTNSPDIAAPENPSVTLEKTVNGGALIGVEAEYQFMPLVSIAAGVNYSLQGAAWKDKDVVVNGTEYEYRDVKSELGYVTVPVTFNYYIFKGFAVKAGVQFGFLTNAEDKYTLENGGRTTEVSESFRSDCKKFDLSIPMGVSYQFNVPIVVDLRYNLGLSKVNKESIPGYDDRKNSVVQLTVGYKFAL